MYEGMTTPKHQEWSIEKAQSLGDLLKTISALDGMKELRAPGEDPQTIDVSHLRDVAMRIKEAISTEDMKRLGEILQEETISSSITTQGGLHEKFCNLLQQKIDSLV
jgi:hypothetical protein